MKELPKSMQRVALTTVFTSVCACAGLLMSTAFAEDAQHARADQSDSSKAKPASKAKAKSVKKAAESATPPAAASASADVEKPAPAPAAPVPQPEAAQVDPVCKLGEAEQPRGGRLDVLGDRFGSAPVVRIAGKPARILIRKQDRISVQVPADSNGGEITLLNDGKVASCGTLVIIGKNR
jgi:hypothetical protein